MEQVKTGSKTLTVRLSPRADQALREMAPYRRCLGRTISELVLAEQARRETRAEAGKAKAEKVEG